MFLFSHIFKNGYFFAHFPVGAYPIEHVRHRKAYKLYNRKTSVSCFCSKSVYQSKREIQELFK